jgi:nanoRNase/pAp phosphatase (c-di-AMP/oligoRNAs hydrolase)
MGGEKLICFYHSADFDGIASAAIVHMKYPDCRLYGINYGDEIPWHLIEGEEVIICDFSFEPIQEMMFEAKHIAKSLVWIDHHKTSIEEIEEMEGFKVEGIRLVGVAACELTWQYYMDKPVPFGLKLLASWDVHDMEYSDHIVPFQYGARGIDELYDPTHKIWNILFNDMEWVYKTIRKGHTILQFVEAEHAKVMQLYSFEHDFLNYRAIMVNRGSMNSKAFESVYNPAKHDIMLAFSRIPSGEWSVSIYTDKDDIDVGEIAKQQGGGGHKQAAGFQTKHLWFLK